MSIFDLFKKKTTEISQFPVPELDNLIDSIISQAIEGRSEGYGLAAINTLDAYKTLSHKDENYIKALLEVAVNKLIQAKVKLDKNWSYGSDAYNSYHVIGSLIGFILGKNIMFTDEELFVLTQSFTENLKKAEYNSGIPFKQLLAKIESNMRNGGLTPVLSDTLRLLLVEENPDHLYSEKRKSNEYIKYLLQGSSDVSPDNNDELGQFIIAFLSGIEDKEVKKHWNGLIKHLILSGNKATPSDKALKEAKAYVTDIGKTVFAKQCTHWLELSIRILKEMHKSGTERHAYLMDINHDLLKSAIWLSGAVNDHQLNNLVDEYGLIAYKKLTGVGAISVRTGNACLYAFSILPFKEGISRLTKFRMKIKYPSVLKVVDKCIAQVAKKEGYSQERLEELAVPEFGISAGQIKKTIGDYIAVIGLKSVNEINVYWEINGKVQTGVPAKIKEEYKEELAAFKKLIKEIEAILPVQRDRVEQFYVRSRTWLFGEWKEAYMKHPLMSVVATGLIWHVAEGEQKTQVLIAGNELRDVNDLSVNWITDNSQVQLWHPIGFTAEDVLKWRERLEELQIKQPFKQAYREVYIITDAELNTNSYSNRFAAHMLRQHQFAALCKQRGWQYTLMGNWDSHNTPTLNLPLWNIRVEYFVDADWDANAVNQSGIFNYISTDQVRFFRAGEQIALADVSAMVFTEVMRDVDLFVGVTSIGNDPTWADNGNQQMNAYWREYSFSELSESSKIREQVLKRLIPRLKIASVCSFDGKFLVVKGKIRTYKIHIGSGNILMDPNNQYLCIVPSRSQKGSDKLFLPFEGDNMLSIIISKALLLADDEKITDSTITSQIGQR